MIPFTPRPWQQIGIEWITEHPRCALFLKMGMGKSATVLAALDELSLVEKVFPVLILAPYRVANSTWPGEIEKWDDFNHFRIERVLGTETERVAALKRRADIYTMNYENIPWLIKKLNGKWPFRTVVVDESTKLKGHRLRQGGERTKALAKHANKPTRWINLTGSPSPNGLKDLWGQQWFVDEGERLGRSYDAFMGRWFQRSFDGYSVDPLPHAQEQIQKRLQDCCLYVDPRDYFDLRKPVEVTRYAILPPKARQQYRDMEKKMFVEIEKDGVEIEALNAAARTNKCLQIGNGVIYLNDELGKPKQWSVLHEQKLDVLEEIIEECAGSPLLVAYQFKSDLAMLTERFKFGRVLDKNPKTEKEWNDGKISLLFAHPASAGHGLNLQDGGHHLCYYSSYWDLELDEQIQERIGPMRQLQSGYDRNVFVYRIVTKDTIEEDVIERLKTKATVQEVLLAALQKNKEKLV